jgi:hypothetical protein
VQLGRPERFPKRAVFDFCPLPPLCQSQIFPLFSVLSGEVAINSAIVVPLVLIPFLAYPTLLALAGIPYGRGGRGVSLVSFSHADNIIHLVEGSRDSGRVNRSRERKQSCLPMDRFKLHCRRALGVTDHPSLGFVSSTVLKITSSNREKQSRYLRPEPTQPSQDPWAYR